MVRDPGLSLERFVAPYARGRHACSPSHGPRTTALGPLLEGRETRLTDGFPITRLMLFEQSVAHQKRDAAFADLAGATMATPRERRSRSLLARAVDGAFVAI